jgi:DNA-binding NtrC family response regulator
LIADADPLVRRSLREVLEHAGHEVHEASTADELIVHAERGVDVVLADMRLPDEDGLRLLARLRAQQPDTPIIVITAFYTVRAAVEAMRLGAFYFLAKPFALDEVTYIVSQALERTGLRREMRALRARQSSAGEIGMLVGESRAMREAQDLIVKYARSATSTVLITGESGTGKDVAARVLHALSTRREAPFMNITCSAMPESLLESELFGHERGAFTDARHQKKGLLELAAGGTVFLDEVGELTLGMQAKLLRFLEERALRRVGGATEIRPDVRVIAATNRDLAESVVAKTFRGDLFYRLGVLQLRMPPLRDRPGDISLLSKHFVEQFGRQFGKDILGVRAEAIALLETYVWPGNVRELRNAIERAVLLAEGEWLEPHDFPGFHVDTSISARPFLLPAGGVDLQELERDLVVQALDRVNHNQTRAARLLGITRDQMRYRMEKFGLL